MDDELNQILVNPLAPGVRLHAIIDACHSGSMLDLEVQAECKNGDTHWRNEYKKRPKRYKVRCPCPKHKLIFGACKGQLLCRNNSQPAPITQLQAAGPSSSQGTAWGASCPHAASACWCLNQRHVTIGDKVWGQWSRVQGSACAEAASLNHSRSSL